MNEQSPVVQLVTALADDFLLTDMCIAYLSGQVDGSVSEQQWLALAPAHQEQVKALIRPLLPFVRSEASRAEAAEAEVARLTARVSELEAQEQSWSEADFRALWQAYGGAPDSTLTEDAQALKRRLREIVGDLERTTQGAAREMAAAIGNARTELRQMCSCDHHRRFGTTCGYTDEACVLWKTDEALKPALAAYRALSLEESSCQSPSDRDLSGIAGRAMGNSEEP